MNITKKIKHRTYEDDEFKEGMLIECIKSNTGYGITNGEVYEVVSVDSGFNEHGLKIFFMNDRGDHMSKVINARHPSMHFDVYFKIVRISKRKFKNSLQSQKN